MFLNRIRFCAKKFQYSRYKLFDGERVCILLHNKDCLKARQRIERKISDEFTTVKGDGQ